jgi:putative ABC transport system permease protein
MFFNYFRIALRNLAKYKIFSFINIGGMAISLASAFLIALFVWDELKFDRHIEGGDLKYRIYNINKAGNYLPIVPYPFASYMKKDFPEIESTLRLMDTYSDRLFEAGDKRILEGGGRHAARLRA